MKKRESFLAFYYLINECFFACKDELSEDENFYLAGFASSICPELWGCGKPITDADFDLWAAQIDTEALNKDNMAEAAVRFLDYYENRFQFDFKKAKETLRRIATPQMVEDALDYARDMYEEYDYDD